MNKPKQHLTYDRIGEKIDYLVSRLKRRVGDEWTTWDIVEEGIRFDETISQELSNSTRKRKVGPSGQTIRNWRAGKPAYQAKVDAAVKALAQQSNIQPPLTAQDLSDDVSRAEFAARLTMDAYDGEAKYRDEAKKWAKTNVKGLHFVVPNDTTSKDYENDYSAHWIVERMDATKKARRGGKWTELRLATTCVAEISNEKRERWRFLMCELSVPRYHDGKERYYYKGYFSRKFTVPTWLFFEDTTSNPDMLVMMTNESLQKGKKTIDGFMLTATQESDYRAVPYRVKIRWHQKYSTVEKMREFLKGGPLGSTHAKTR